LAPTSWIARGPATPSHKPMSCAGRGPGRAPGTW